MLNRAASHVCLITCLLGYIIADEACVTDEVVAVSDFIKAEDVKGAKCRRSSNH